MAFHGWQLDTTDIATHIVFALWYCWWFSSGAGAGDGVCAYVGAVVLAGVGIGIGAGSDVDNYSNYTFYLTI